MQRAVAAVKKPRRQAVGALAVVAADGLLLFRFRRRFRVRRRGGFGIVRGLRRLGVVVGSWCRLCSDLLWPAVVLGLLDFVPWRRALHRRWCAAVGLVLLPVLDLALAAAVFGSLANIAGLGLTPPWMESSGAPQLAQTQGETKGAPWSDFEQVYELVPAITPIWAELMISSKSIELAG